MAHLQTQEVTILAYRWNFNHNPIKMALPFHVGPSFPITRQNSPIIIRMASLQLIWSLEGLPYLDWHFAQFCLQGKVAVRIHKRISSYITLWGAFWENKGPLLGSPLWERTFVLLPHSIWALTLYTHEALPAIKDTSLCSWTVFIRIEQNCLHHQSSQLPLFLSAS